MLVLHNTAQNSLLEGDNSQERHWNGLHAFYHAMRGYATVCRLSVCLGHSGTMISDHIRWNTSKIIPWLISFRFMLRLTPTWAIWSLWCNGAPPKLGWNRVGVISTKIHKNLWNSATRTKVTITVLSHTNFWLVPKSTTLDDFERPKHTLAEKLFYEAYQKNLYRPILSVAKSRSTILVSRNKRYMWIFAGVPWEAGFKWQCCRPRHFLAISVDLLLLKLSTEGQHCYIAISNPLPACNLLQNKWPSARMTLNSYFMSNSVFMPATLPRALGFQSPPQKQTNEDRST